MMKTREYLAIMVGLVFIYIILWYLTLNKWMPSSFLTPVWQLLVLFGLVATGIFVVTQLKGE